MQVIYSCFTYETHFLTGSYSLMLYIAFVSNCQKRVKKFSKNVTVRCLFLVNFLRNNNYMLTTMYTTIYNFNSKQQL